MSVWPLVPLGELISPAPSALTDGPFGSKLKTEHYTASGVRVIRLGNIGVGEFKDDDQSYVSEAHASELQRHAVYEGDLLIAALAEPVGRCCEVPARILPAIVKADCIRFRPRDTLNRRFIMHWLNSPTGRKNSERHSHGVGRLRINMGAIRSLLVPVASRVEQDQVVAAIETHFSRLDAAVESLKRAKANVKRARASVLKAAVEGRLVPTEAALARAEGRTFEPASALLAKILDERKAAWLKSGARGKYKEPVPPDTTNLPKLPEGWCWTTVDQIAGEGGTSLCDGPFGSNLKTEHYTDEGPRVVRLQNIGEGVFRDERAHITPEHFSRLRKYAVKAGDLVVASLGESLPRACIIPEWLGSAIVKADCIRLRPTQLALREFLNISLNSPPIVNRTTAKVHGVGRPRLGLAGIREIAVPLPPLPEQARVAHEVARRMSVIDALDATLDTNLARCVRLRQSVLKRAFEGRLVDAQAPQEAAPPAVADQLPLFAKKARL